MERYNVIRSNIDIIHVLLYSMIYSFIGGIGSGKGGHMIKVKVKVNVIGMSHVIRLC